MKVEFIGLGYIGLPSAALAAASGFSVLGVDINESYLNNILNGNIDEKEPNLKAIVQEQIHNNNLKISSSPDYADIFVIVVPTPFNEKKEPNLEIIYSAIDSIIPFLNANNLLILESTCPVGTTEEIASYIFKKRKDLKGKLSISYCPERVLPGNILSELKTNNRIVGGIDEKSSELAHSYYSKFVDGEIIKTNAKTAELCKLSENSYRDIQISFANELSIISEKLDIDVWDLIKLTNKHPRVNILNPGVGVGGHCIAVDPWFLISAFESESKVIKAAREQNLKKTDWCINKINNEINLISKRLNKNKIEVALMGLSYKQNVSDCRESPAIYISKKISLENVANIHYVEPNLRELENYELSIPEDAYKKSDLVVWLVPHDEFRKIKKDFNKFEIDFCGIRQ